MKIPYVFFPVLVCLSAVLTGCFSLGIETSGVKTDVGFATNTAIYFDTVGRGRQVYPPQVVDEVPISYAPSYVPAVGVGYVNTVPAYYSGPYHGREVSNINYGPWVRHDQGPPPVKPPVRIDYPPRIDPPPQRPAYVQPPYILKPSGSVTVVTPTYGPPSKPAPRPPRSSP